jgi:hypothetical protein
LTDFQPPSPLAVLDAVFAPARAERMEAAG